MKPIETLEELQRECCDWRGIEDPCKTCGGSGTRAYGSTSTWHGGVGGQMITNGVCDKCWGSGDAHRPWPSRRKMESQAATIDRLTARIAKLEKALKPFAAMAPVFPDDTGYVVCRVRACDDLDLKITGADLHAAARTTLEASGRGGEK